MAEEHLSDVLLTLDPRLLNEHVDAFLLDEDKLSLPQLIPRIIHERGAFLNITELSLQAEIEKEEAALVAAAAASSSMDESSSSAVVVDNDDDDGDVYPEGSIGSVSTNEDFFKNKNEVLKNISTALNESSLALDFVSLLISCVRPAAGTISMSAHLKKFVPPGSLNADQVRKEITAQEKEERYKEEKNVGQGWKLGSLENSATNLRGASARLSEEVHREKMFWDTIKKNFSKKEILYKTRDKTTGKRLFAVKYGYEDSGSTYRVTGNAVLKPVNGGDQIEFVPLSSKATLVKKVMRVRILGKRDNEDELSIIGESKVDGGFKNDDSIKSQIERARYFVFEEELFNQLMDEATGLVAYNVKAENESKISIELQDQSIEIEHVEYDDEESPSNEECIKRPDDTRAEMFATFLRLMLTMKHKRNVDSKRQLTVMKTGISSRLSQRPYLLILRPLVGHFRHEHMVQMIHAMVRNVLHNIDNTSFKLKRYCNLTKDELVKDPFKRISEPPRSKFTLLVSDSLKVILELDSFDFVNFRVNTSAVSKGKKVLKSTFEDLRQIEECLEWLITEYHQENSGV